MERRRRLRCPSRELPPPPRFFRSPPGIRTRRCSPKSSSCPSPATTAYSHSPKSRHPALRSRTTAHSAAACSSTVNRWKHRRGYDVRHDRTVPDPDRCLRRRRGQRPASRRHSHAFTATTTDVRADDQSHRDTAPTLSERPIRFRITPRERWRSALSGRSGRDPRGAMWANTPEGIAQAHREHLAAFKASKRAHKR
jgi:hypothetical protein